MKAKQLKSRGFTLVELSIVLVIIGLIVGGALTGKQIIKNAQITNAINAIQSYEAQFQSYVQNYGAIPGDDDKAKDRFENIFFAVASSNGTLDGSFDSQSDEDETRLAWADLRGAGLVKGSGSDASQPINPFGGIYGFQHGAFSDSLSFTSPVICMNNVPGDAAGAIDARLDDGDINAGSAMAMISTGETGEALDKGDVVTSTNAYEASKTYTICIKM